MTIFVSGATVTLRAHQHRLGLGVLFVPAVCATPATTLWPGARWAADNGAFSAFDADAFVTMLAQLRGISGCQFVTAPDVVANAEQTRRLFDLWEPMIHSLGFPVALVSQDGLTGSDVPWDRLDALFIGGSTEWKLSREARVIGAYAKARGKWLHMGRVNSKRRIHYAERIGCDSIDGTCFSRWSNVFIPKGLAWMQPLPLLASLENK